MLGSKKPKKPENIKNQTQDETSPHNDTNRQNGKNDTHLPHNETHSPKKNSTKNHRALQITENKSNKTNFGRDQKPPQPPKNVTF
jgi:hypothetical protein